ncbi:uncharacterized protein BO87DRAFT_320951, partial [Aspergillus neoniger CBS 115656]
GADEARRCAHGGEKGGQAERGGPCDPKETSESEKGTADHEGDRAGPRVEEEEKKEERIDYYLVCKAERETKKRGGGKGEGERGKTRQTDRQTERSKPVTAEGSPDLVGCSPGRHLGSLNLALHAGDSLGVSIGLNGRNENQFPRAAEALVAADPGRFRTYLRHE